jgi:hypothetical protein
VPILDTPDDEGWDDEEQTLIGDLADELGDE